LTDDARSADDCDCEGSGLVHGISLGVL
jgi:hypothetical protein